MQDSGERTLLHLAAARSSSNSIAEYSLDDINKSVEPSIPLLDCT